MNWHLHWCDMDFGAGDLRNFIGENFIYVKQRQISPETKVFSNLEPTMLYYDGSQSGVNLTIGKDAGYYHKECPNVLWNEERQPFGYAGVRRLFEALAEV